VQIQKNVLYCVRYHKGKDPRRDSWALESWTAEMYQREVGHLSERQGDESVRTMDTKETLLWTSPRNHPLCSKEPSQCLTCRSLMQGVSGAGSGTGAVAGWAEPRKAWRATAEDTGNVRPEEWRSASESATRNRGDRVRTRLARRTLQLLRRLSSRQCRKASQSALSLESGLSLAVMCGQCDCTKKLKEIEVGL
jgi:hypothetical protein